MFYGIEIVAIRGEKLQNRILGTGELRLHICSCNRWVKYLVWCNIMRCVAITGRTID